MAPSRKLQVVSYLAPNMFWFYKTVSEYLGRALDVDVQISEGECDPLDDQLLLQDQVDIAFICGLPFIRRHHLTAEQLEAIAAPVMKGARYQNRPIYFSDVVVNAASLFTQFEELSGKTFCYNDPGSNSGYNLMRQKLLQANYPSHFFGKVIQSGSHQRSLRWVADGLADCAAIDSTVLEQELRDYPELAMHLRIIDSIGPCPMPPVVVAKHLGSPMINQIQTALLNPDVALQNAMERAQIKGYVAVQSDDYEAIAQSYSAALQAGYGVLAEGGRRKAEG